MCVGRYAEKMSWSEAKWNLFEMPAICQYCAFQRNATTSNCPLNAKSHPAGMHICYAIFTGISLRLCSISLRSFRKTLAAYLSTHINSLRDFFQSLLNNHRDNLYIISKTKTNYQRQRYRLNFFNFLTS